MKTLSVEIERQGKPIQVGEIVCTDAGEARFRYNEAYLASPLAAAVSIRLPLGKDPFSPEETRNFFEGLLPEGFTRRSVAGWLHVGADDYLSMLARLGQECLGAIRIAEPGQGKTVAAYERLSRERVAELAREGVTLSAQLVTKAHLSLTGASGKAGLYYEPGQDLWYLPLGEAPSTHIVKQSHVRLNAIVANEQLCLLAARRLGIEVPESFIIRTGSPEDENVLFATRRYDRDLSGSIETLDGLPRPLRLHQEDFAQALGIPSQDKYEAERGGYLGKIFTLLRNYSASPIEDQLKLWDILIFDYLVGNTDNHIKNLSLLYSADLKSMRLAPAYDIVSTAVYESSTRDMALSIGGRLSLDEITEAAFIDAAQEIHLNQKMAADRFDRLCAHFEQALKESARQLAEDGFLQAESLCGRILTLGGYGAL